MDWSVLKNYDPGANGNGAVRSTLIIVSVLVVFFFIFYFILKKVDPLKRTPKWLVPFLWVVDLVNGFVKENIGIRWKSYAPWFLSIGIFLFFSNTSAVYCLNNPTGYVIVNLALALTSFVIIQASGIVSNGFLGYLKGFCDPNPVMLPMNIVSEFTFPLSLCLRLFGNIISGTCISILIKGLFDGWFELCVIPVMPFVNAIFDIALSTIQVLVFVLLSVIFASMKIKDEEKIYSK